jgi:hypothetical protein
MLTSSHSPLDDCTSPRGHTSSSEELDDELAASPGTQSIDVNDHTSGGEHPTLTSSHSPLDACTRPIGHPSAPEELDDEEVDASVDTQPMDATDHTRGGAQLTLRYSHSPLEARTSPGAHGAGSDNAVGRSANTSC